MVQIKLSDLARHSANRVSISDIVPRFLTGPPLLEDPKFFSPGPEPDNGGPVSTSKDCVEKEQITLLLLLLLQLLYFYR